MRDSIVFGITMIVTGIIFNTIYALWKTRKIKKRYKNEQLELTMKMLDEFDAFKTNDI